jgi:hypothetical protein
MNPKIVTLYSGEGTVQRNPRSKPRNCYTVTAVTDQGEFLAARFTSRKRADQFADNALARLHYSFADRDNRYQALRFDPEANEPMFGWGTGPGGFVHWFIDEPLTGPFMLRWSEVAR